MLSIPIRTPDGQTIYALVDDEDSDLLHYAWHLSGGKTPQGQKNVGKYAATARTVAGKQRTIFMHRVVAARMGLISDPFTVAPSEERGRWRYSIDHDNGNKLDNQRQNLKLRDRQQQMTNPNDRLRANNTSGVRGVSYCPSRESFGKPWRATITENGRGITLGWFATVEEAAFARRSYEEAADKKQWLANDRARGKGRTGHRGVVEMGGRFYASIPEGDGAKIALGGYGTAEEAAAAIQDYLASDDKAAWLERLKSKPQSNGSSGYRGVTFLKQVRERQWQAYATENGKRVNLGRYDTVEEAAAARRAWEEAQP